MSAPTRDPCDVTLRALGEGEPETFRGRIYGLDTPEPVPTMDQQMDRVMREATSEGCIECPAYDDAIGELTARGWLDVPTMWAVEGGRVAVWFATEKGKSEHR